MILQLPEPLCLYVVPARALPDLDAVVNAEGAGGAVLGRPAVGSGGARALVLGDDIPVELPEARIELRVLEHDEEAWRDSPDDDVADAVIDAEYDLVVELMEVHDRVEAVEQTTAVARRLADLTGGAVLDPLCARTLPPSDPDARPGGVETHVVIHAVTGDDDDDDDESAWLHTHGLIKFGRPELELRHVPRELVEVGARFLNNLGQYLIDGAAVLPGETVGARGAPLIARESNDVAEHEPDIPMLELVDVGDDGEPVESGVERGLRAWADE